MSSSFLRCSSSPALGRGASGVAHSAALMGLVLIVLLASPAIVGASSGDISWDFWHCTAVCEATGCTPAPAQDQQQRRLENCSPLCPLGKGAASSQPVPLPLRLWRWDCTADCRYLCMWQREEGKHAAGTSTASGAAAPPALVKEEKYFGKWPFARLLGMQEPASVLLSLLNLAAQLRCLLCYLRLLERWAPAGGGGPTSAVAGGHQAPALATWRSPARTGTAVVGTTAAPDRAAACRCRSLWVAHFCLSAAAWLFSAVFHGRDTRLTERLDYYVAGALVAFNLFLTTARTLRLASPLPRLALAAAILGYYAWHTYHMQFTLFDYGLHVKTCIAAGIVQAVLWVCWALGPAPRAHRGRPWLLAFVALIHTSMLLEAYDFPPFWHILDAHACWHIATVPLAYLWYKFIAEDWLYGCAGLAAGSKQAE